MAYQHIFCESRPPKIAVLVVQRTILMLHYMHCAIGGSFVCATRKTEDRRSARVRAAHNNVQCTVLQKCSYAVCVQSRRLGSRPSTSAARARPVMPHGNVIRR